MNSQVVKLKTDVSEALKMNQKDMETIVGNLTFISNNPTSDPNEIEQDIGVMRQMMSRLVEYGILFGQMADVASSMMKELIEISADDIKELVDIYERINHERDEVNRLLVPFSNCIDLKTERLKAVRERR